MQLFFLRHAHAQPNDDGSLSDEKRALTDKGLKQAQHMARLLQHLTVDLDRLYTSPLVRARQTADFVADALKIPLEERRELAPGFDTGAFNALIRDLEDDLAVMFVGHEPDFSTVIGQLIGGGRVVMKKCGLARLDMLERKPVVCELAWMLPPKVFMGLD